MFRGRYEQEGLIEMDSLDQLGKKKFCYTKIFKMFQVYRPYSKMATILVLFCLLTN